MSEGAFSFHPFNVNSDGISFFEGNSEKGAGVTNAGIVIIGTFYLGTAVGEIFEIDSSFGKLAVKPPICQEIVDLS